MSELRILVVSMRNKKHRIRLVCAALAASILLFSSCVQYVHPQLQPIIAVQVTYDVDSVGYFSTVGNMPFTQVVYRDNNGQYEVPEEYAEYQGYLMRVVGDIYGEGIYGKKLHIVYAKIKE